MKRYSALVLYLLVVAFVVTAADAREKKPSAAEPADRESSSPQSVPLVNPSFEGPYSPYIPPNGHPDCPLGICMTAQMAAGWTPWWVSHNPSDPGHIIRMPEYKPAELNIPGPVRVHSGERAQQYFTFFATHRAGIYQQVAVEAGGYYCLTIWGHSWSSSEDDPYSSNSPLYQKVGIHPYGGVFWNSPSIVWSQEYEQYNEYGQMGTCAIAQNSTITVFTYSEPLWAVKHNDVYWDDADLALNLALSPDNGFTFLAEISTPISRSVLTDIILPPGANMSWDAAVEPGGDFNVLLNQTSGVPGEDLVITVDSTGLSLGTHTAAVTISTNPALPGSPSTIPIRLKIVEQLNVYSVPIFAR